MWRACSARFPTAAVDVGGVGGFAELGDGVGDCCGRRHVPSSASAWSTAVSNFESIEGCISGCHGATTKFLALSIRQRCNGMMVMVMVHGTVYRRAPDLTPRKESSNGS
mmetsp:Transcript_55468/g.117950  ORF Transcript_55468/g.117950 Transcript_55468/m.117950 type:complete len:109 (-) Transcript_55468:47-373(-)